MSRDNNSSVISPKHIFISPHHDDICYSLGGYIKGLPGSLLINVFTESTHALGMQNLDIKTISNMRLEEDKIFSAKCNLHQYNLGLRDASIFIDIPYDHSILDQEIAQVKSVLLPVLWDLLSTSKESPPIHIYCPLGIGDHRNHLSVFMAIFQNYEQLQSKAKFYFYEDLPYASNTTLRDNGLKRLRSMASGKKLKRLTIPLTLSLFIEKLKLIHLYPSQNLGSINKHHFIPGDSMHTYPHEALWQIAEDN